MGSHLNGGNNDNEPPTEHKIVNIPTLAERDRIRREKEKMAHQSQGASEPLLNIPPATTSLLGLIIAIHIIVTQVLSPDQTAALIGTFGFTPAAFSSGMPDAVAFVTPITHMFLHGSWTHLVMNALMLAAFGSGIERWLGARRMLILFFLSGLCGVATHYILNTNSVFPLIGASGGLSGFFAAALIMLNRGQREIGGRFGILPFALLWIGLSIGFGMMGGPDGSMIAWAAHVGGFLGGFVILKLMRV